MWFERLVIVAIVLSAIVTGASTHDLAPTYKDWIWWLDNGINLFFIGELIIRLRANGWSYFKSKLNCLDAAIILIAMFPATGSLIGLRIIRLFRVLRVFTISKEMRLLTLAMGKSLKGVVYIGLYIFVVYYVYAIVGYHLFNEVDPTRWSSATEGLWTLWQIDIGEDSVDVTEPMRIIHPMVGPLFHITFVALVDWVLKGFLIAILWNSFEKAKDEIKAKWGGE